MYAISQVVFTPGPSILATIRASRLRYSEKSGGKVDHSGTRRDTPLQEKWNGSKIERDDERRGWLRFRCFEVSRIRERFFFFETRIKMDNQLRRVTPAEIESMRANYLRVYADNRDKRAWREHTIAHLREHTVQRYTREKSGQR